MSWTSYFDRGELGLHPISTMNVGPEWWTLTHIGEPKECGTKDRKLRAEIVAISTLREKEMSENGEWNLGVPAFSDGECFLLKKIEKAMPPITGLQVLRVVDGFSSAKLGQKWKKKSIDLYRHIQVRELSEIWDVNHRTEFIWIQ